VGHRSRAADLRAALLGTRVRHSEPAQRALRKTQSKQGYFAFFSVSEGVPDRK
jgi:hypothetical protein